MSNIPCRYCVKQEHCNKVHVGSCCSFLEVDEAGTKLLDEDNAKNLRWLLSYAITTGEKDVSVDDPKFQEWTQSSGEKSQ